MGTERLRSITLTRDLAEPSNHDLEVPACPSSDVETDFLSDVPPPKRVLDLAVRANLDPVDGDDPITFDEPGLGELAPGSRRRQERQTALTIRLATCPGPCGHGQCRSNAAA